MTAKLMGFGGSCVNLAAYKAAQGISEELERRNMQGMRKSVAAWQLLQRMNQTDAGVIWNADSGRFHFILHCRATDPIDQRSITLLADNGLVKREKSSIPVYTISDKGREALAHREAPETIAEDEAISETL
jgi:hypothetical protein